MTELERFADAVPFMQIIREFLDWCEEQNIELASPLPNGVHLYPVNEGREQMFARYFKINAAKLEKERCALLAKQRSLNARASRKANG